MAKARMSAALILRAFRVVESALRFWEVIGCSLENAFLIVSRKDRIMGNALRKHTAGAKAREDYRDCMPGMNPWPSARKSFWQRVKSRYPVSQKNSPHL